MQNEKIHVVAPKQFIAVDFLRRTEKDVRQLKYVSSVNDLRGFDGQGKELFVLIANSPRFEHYSPWELIHWARLRGFTITHIAKW